MKASSPPPCRWRAKRWAASPLARLPTPIPTMDEALTWDDLIAQGLVTRKTVTNAEVQALFDGTTWEDDDPEALDDPEGLYLDLWVVDPGPQIHRPGGALGGQLSTRCKDFRRNFHQ